LLFFIFLCLLSMRLWVPLAPAILGMNTSAGCLLLYGRSKRSRSGYSFRSPKL
jgi:hypothetical protein